MDYAGKKVVVALSGGVDSTAAALLAKAAGCQVIGATLDLAPAEPEWKCAWGCGSEDEKLIRTVADKLEIEHTFINAAAEFEELVLKNCYEVYSSGRTPNPCVLCNPAIKFGLLAKYARSIGAEALLTGHYAKFSSEKLIVRGDDPKKDQSYFLYRLPRELLDFIQFPVGSLQKNQVRAMVAEAGLPVAHRPDSQDACFVFPGESFAETLFRRFNGKSRSGNFIYQGKVVGRHAGLHRCTVGQRKGLNVALGVPAYVKSIDNTSGDIELVTDQNLLACQKFYINQVNFQTPILPDPSEELLIQIRYRTPAAAGRVIPQGDGSFVVELNEPQRAVTPGQSAVIYRGNTLLGGGIIGL
ncbi:MAG: tRNA 2-thiouridine(34) synthase MnmA [Lentisphaerae bacterium]|nr:tRNA 2-thiouridine(34) synthase MnmA [Lentisphaerota bacterium]